MNYFFYTLFLFTLFYTSLGTSAALQFVMSSPQKASTNGEPFAVIVAIDPQEQKISALSGAFVFDSTHFDLLGVSTRSSIVSLWTKQPKFSNLSKDGSMGVISFEGIMPGGFDGVKSPFFEGVRPGVVFSLLLLPKKEGESIISLRSPKAHLFSEDGVEVPVDSVVKKIIVPKQVISFGYSKPVARETKSGTLIVGIVREPLIANGKAFLSVVEDESIRPIEKVFVSESKEYSSKKIEESDWKEVVGMHVLKYQNRSRYVHVKIIYENNTYTFVTIPPVENSNKNRVLSLILVSIIIVSSVLYLYAKQRITHLFTTIKNKLKKS